MHLYVLPITWSELGWRYTFAEVWPALASTHLALALLVLGESHFQAYDWTHQELWLAAPTVRVLEADGRARLFDNPAGQAFVVTLGDKRLYSASPRLGMAVERGLLDAGASADCGSASRSVAAGAHTARVRSAGTQTARARRALGQDSQNALHNNHMKRAGRGQRFV